MDAHLSKKNDICYTDALQIRQQIYAVSLFRNTLYLLLENDLFGQQDESGSTIKPPFHAKEPSTGGAS